MKRCAECGFRDRTDALTHCPLCGVRMTREENVRLDTHVHKGKERCLLPNQAGDKAAKPDRTIAPGKTKGQRPKSMEYVGMGMVVVVYALLRACAG